MSVGLNSDSIWGFNSGVDHHNANRNGFQSSNWSFFPVSIYKIQQKISQTRQSFGLQRQIAMDVTDFIG